MKSFFVNAGKAMCYFLLFIAVQFAVTYMYIMFEVFRIAAADPDAFLNSFMTDFSSVYLDIAQKAVNATDTLYIFMFIINVALLLLIFHMRGKNIFKETWMRPFKMSSAWPIPIAAICASVVALMVIGTIPWPEWAIDQYAEMSGTAINMSVVSVISTCILAPILEELTFRGLVFTRLCRGMPAVAAAILTATIFAAVHGNIVWACYAFILGIVMILIYVKYRSLYASMIFHIIFNLWGGFVQPLLLDSISEDANVMIVLMELTLGIAIAWVIAKMPRSRIDIS